MASRHEYEMLFQLSAKMGSGFAGTFSKAQQQILAIQKEVQELNQLQGDISAYQKQQAAVEATNKKLSVLQAQYDNIQREIQETEGFSSSLENKLLSKQQQIDKTSASLEKQTQKLSDMGQALQEAGIDTEHLEQENERLDASMTDLKETQEEVAESAEDFGDKSVNAFEAINDAIVSAGIVAALHEIYEAYAECITITGEFEDSLANVEALSGATSQEMGQLSDLAKELGATTQFTAKESADAMGYMAMAGWDAQQMISGMPGVLKLAAASGEDLAMVSDIVTDSMTAFGLTAADTAHYADVLAAAATSANTNVSLMGETFKYAAPMAGALGYDVEDVAIAVGMMANAGIKGSQAGTSLNNIFTRLAKPTKESADAMDALGISLLDGSGHMYTFMELMEIMRDRFAGLTETQKAFYAAELAGQRGMSGLLSIVNASESDFASLSESITGCAGAAERMAAIKLDTMNGQLTLAQSAAEALKTTVGEQFTPILKNLYTEEANVMTEVNAFLQANPGVIKGVTAVAIGVGAMTAGITGFVAITKVAVPLMTAFTASIPGVGLIMGIGTALTALTAGMILFRNEFDDTTFTAREQQAELERLQAEYEDVCNVYGETSSEANALRYQINALTAEYEASGHSIQGLIREHESLISAAKESAQVYQESMGQIHEESLDAMALGGELRRLSDSYTGAAGEAQMMGRIIEELNSRYEGLDLTLEDVTSGTYDWGESLDAYIRQAAEAQERTEKLDRAVELLSEHRQLELDAEKITEEIRAAEEEVQRLKELRDSTATGYNGSSVYDVDYSRAVSQLAEYRAALDETNAALQANEEEYAAINEALGGTGEALSGTEEAGQRLQNIINVTASELDGLVEAYNEAYNAAYDSVQGQYEMWDEAAEVIPTSVEKMTKAMQGQIDYWQEYRENLEYLRDQAVNIEGLDEILNNLADGSEESVNAVAGIAGALRDGSGDVGAMVGAYQDLKTEQDKVSQSMADTATNFSQKLVEMQTSLEKAVHDMDVSDLAEESARSTIQGFINQADAMVDSVQTAYYNLGQAAARALESSFNNITANLKMPSLPSLPGYATGTHYAEPGLHPVGEHGAEIVFFGGSRDVPDLQEIRRMREDLMILHRTSPGQDSETIRTFERITREVRDRVPEMSDGMLVGENGPELMYFTGGETVLTANETRELQRETALLSRAFTEQLIPMETTGERGAGSLSFAFPLAGVYGHEGTPGTAQTNRETPWTGRDTEAVRAMERVYREIQLLPGHGDGVKATAAGAALVGTYGPELLQFQGGEKVLTARETRELQRETNLLLGAVSKGPSLFNHPLTGGGLFSIPGYAGGTESAAPGTALVGEVGQELVLWGGREKTLDSREIRELREKIPLLANADGLRGPFFDAAMVPDSSAIYPIGPGNPLTAELVDAVIPDARNPLEAEWDTAGEPWPDPVRRGGGSGSYTITLSPVYQNYFNGETRPEDVERAMLANTENLREQVVRIMEDIAGDKVRSDFR